MESSNKSQTRTRMFGRVMGPYMAILAVIAALRPDELRVMLSKFEADPLMSWVAGVFTLLLGLVVVALHPYWRGGAAIIVSVVGWLVAIQGLLLVVGSHAYFAVAASAVDTMGWATAGAAVEVLTVLFLGLYLSLVSWAPGRKRSVSQPVSSTPDLPHAA
ncbi:MAG TPA: hypothetical protein VMB04_00510 [Mycobacterium sp.]|nr:hypothetical protein [Mycobacterium sp.]